MATSSLGYRPAIDGIRAIAVLMVVLYHLHVPGLTGGYVGVDVFFTISGYLIFGIIWKQLGEGTFSFGTFYTRRVLRLLPALLVTSLGTLVAGAFLQLPHDFGRLGTGVASTMAYASNVWLFRNTGYFESRAELLPTLHTWSLSVEEQFYFAAPLALVWLHRSARARATWVLGSVAVLTLVGTQAMLRTHQPLVFYLSPFRVWEFVIGGLLAVTGTTLPRGGKTRVLALVALLAVLIPAVAYTPQTPFPGLSALVPCAGTALLLVATGPATDGWVKRVLETSPMVWIGRLSYAIYLWHWPVIALWLHRFGRVPGSGPGLGVTIAIQASLTLLLATLTYRVVETPLRAPAEGRIRTVLFGSLAVSAGLFALGAVLDRTKGFPDRVAPIVATLDREREPVVPFRGCFGPRQDPRACVLGAEQAEAEPRWLLWGDSHALALAPALDALLKERGERGLLAASGLCPPLLGVTTQHARLGASDCEPLQRHVESILDTSPGLRHVLLVGVWSGYIEPDQSLTLTGLGRETAPAEVFAAGLGRTVDKLLAGHREIVVVRDVPTIPWDVPFELARAKLHGVAAPATPRLSEVRQIQRSFDERLAAIVASRGPQGGAITIVDLPATLCAGADQRCRVGDANGLPWYRDRDHLNVRGAYAVVPALRGHQR